MRVLMSAVLQPSHFFPLVPLGWALRAAGHDVRVAHQPCLSPFVEAAGLSSVIVGTDMQLDPKTQQHADTEMRTRKAGSTRPTAAEQERHTRATLRLFAGAAGLMAEELVEFARTWAPDLVVFEWQAYAAHLAAEVLGIPSVRHQFAGPDYEAGVPGWRAMEQEALDALYRSHGVAQVAPDGVFTIDPCPPNLQFDLPAQRRYLPVRYVPYNGNGRVEDWMHQRTGKPRVALTLGGTYLWMMGNLSPVQAFIDALSELDMEIIAAVPRGGADIVATTNPDVRVVENVPLELFLPSCDAVISHGGTGTFATALAHGVPQIISPPSSMGEPPFHNAQRITAAGAGAQVDIHTDPPSRIREVVGAVAGEASYKAAAQLLADEVRKRPLPLELVPDLEAAAAGGVRT